MSDKLVLGAQLYTLRDYMKTEADYYETIKKVADIGYKTAQVSGIGNVSPAMIAKAAKDFDVKVILTHWNPARIKNNTDEVIEEHNLFDCDYIGIGSLPGYEHTTDGYKRFCDEFAPALEKLKKAGKTLLYHNHRFEFERYDGKTGIDLILENSDPDTLKLTFDVYWGQAGGVNPKSFIKKYQQRIAATHLKDMTVINDAIDMTELGTGNIDFNSILKASQKTGVKYHFVEQDTVKMNAFDSLKISFDNITKTGYFV